MCEREFTDRVERSTVTSGPLHDLVTAGGRPLAGTNPVYLVRSGDRMLHFGSKGQLYEHYRQPGRKSARNTYANMHPGMKAQHDVNVIRRLTNGDEVVAVHRDVGKRVLSEGRAELPARSLSDMRRSLEKMKARTRDTKQSKEARNLQAALDAAEAPGGAGVSPPKKPKKRVQNPRT